MPKPDARSEQPQTGGEKPQAHGLPLRVKFGYGGAEGAGSLIWTVFYTFFLYYLTDVVKMGAGAAGFVVMAGFGETSFAAAGQSISRGAESCRLACTFVGAR